MNKIKKISESAAFWYLLLFGIISVFIVLASFRTHQIVTEDDLACLLPAMTWHETGVPLIPGPAGTQPYYHHPYLYVYSIKLMLDLFGPNAMAARIPGVISGVVSIILTFFIVKLCCPGDERARLKLATIVSGLYALAPTTVQATTMIQVDTSILVPAILLLFLGIVKFFKTGKYAWLAFIVCAVALSLWARLSTPLLLVLVLMMYLLLSKGASTTKLILTGALAAGVLLFIATWYSYCKIKGAPFFGPFMYTFSLVSSAPTNKSFGISQSPNNIVYLAAWLGFFPLAAAIGVMLKRGKELLSDTGSCPHLIFFCGIILMAVYSIVGGVNIGYPRYISPAIPLIYSGAALLIARSEFEKFSIKMVVIFLFASLCIQFFIVRDPVYALRYTMREYLVLWPYVSSAVLKDILLRAIAAGFGYAVIFFFFIRTFSRKAIVGSLVIFSVASTMTMTFLQSAAGYNTGYNYGEKGTEKVSEYVRSRMGPESIIVAPGELVYYMGLLSSRCVNFSFWHEIDAGPIIRLLKDARVSAFIYSVPTNTIDQIRLISGNLSIQELLVRDYNHVKIGSYDVWTRTSKR